MPRATLGGPGDGNEKGVIDFEDKCIRAAAIATSDGRAGARATARALSR